MSITYDFQNGIPTVAHHNLGSNFLAVSKQQELSAYPTHTIINIYMNQTRLGWIKWIKNSQSTHGYWCGYLLVPQSESKIFNLLEDYEESARLGLPIFSYSSRDNGSNVIGWDNNRGQPEHYNLHDTCKMLLRTWFHMMMIDN
ncbi:hypothetical protein [Acanthamoeba polyphaga mimivirus]|uniref:Uncharacterized protein n=2 Tax=Megamimivirinae TaxID=3044648 RepID=A0A2L2DIB9_MIMIV|nr:hypothetical protein MegaChil _gp0179 [Megavirus chiliensis]AEQ33420.1 hypothetical protein [Megavirus chiliensis]AVG45913.1 hypothetical protein [Acanthamoeba polyphaga mimivirus]AVG47016.1 hypothetical protein [Acanthamoeba polyphaga mimivirus]